MTNIHLTVSDQNKVTIQFAFQTPQQFFYNVSVVTAANTQVFHGSGQWDGTTAFDLGPAAALIGAYLIVYWSVIDPVGAGNTVNADATVIHNGVNCIDLQVCSGTSTVAPLPFTTVGLFIIP